MLQLHTQACQSIQRPVPMLGLAIYSMWLPFTNSTQKSAFAVCESGQSPQTCVDPPSSCSKDMPQQGMMPNLTWLLPDTVQSCKTYPPNFYSVRAKGVASITALCSNNMDRPLGCVAHQRRKFQCNPRPTEKIARLNLISAYWSSSKPRNSGLRATEVRHCGTINKKCC